MKSRQELNEQLYSACIEGDHQLIRTKLKEGAEADYKDGDC